MQALSLGKNLHLMSWQPPMSPSCIWHSKSEELVLYRKCYFGSIRWKVESDLGDPYVTRDWTGNHGGCRRQPATIFIWTTEQIQHAISRHPDKTHFKIELKGTGMLPVFPGRNEVLLYKFTEGDELARHRADRKQVCVVQ